MKVIAEISRIDWDTDNEVIDTLPNETTIELEVDDISELDDEVVDKLSDEFGFCVNEFSVCYTDEFGKVIELDDEFGDYVNYVEGKVS